MFIILFVELLWFTLNIGYDIHYLIQIQFICTIILLLRLQIEIREKGINLILCILKKLSVIINS